MVIFFHRNIISSLATVLLYIDIFVAEIFHKFDFSIEWSRLLFIICCISIPQYI